jgi:hypothetical protein
MVVVAAAVNVQRGVRVVELLRRGGSGLRVGGW